MNENLLINSGFSDYLIHQYLKTNTSSYIDEHINQLFDDHIKQIIFLYKYVYHYSDDKIIKLININKEKYFKNIYDINYFMLKNYRNDLL